MFVIALLVFALLSAAHASVLLPKPQEPESFEQFHEATYNLGWDIHMSPYAGGEDILFVHRCIERIEGWLLATSPIYYSRSPQARMFRFSELILGWLPLNYLAIIMEHEIFGHGYRIRDINCGHAQVEGYRFSAPIPYGFGDASTNYSITEKFTMTDETAVAMAGVESTAILAWLTKLKWLEAGYVNPRQTVLYLFGQYDLPLYIGSLKTLGDEDANGHDMKAYVDSVNQVYTATQLNKGKLASLSLINLADAFTYYSIYAWLRYIWSGQEGPIPMIPLFGYGYLPGARMGLTPFGPDYWIEHFLVKHHRPIYFYVKGGWHAQNQYYGFGMYAPTIWTLKRWAFGLRFDGWWQPKLLLQPASQSFAEINLNAPPNPESPLYPYSQQHAMRCGAAGSALISWQMGRGCGLSTELGYKAKGFLPGYALRASLVARIYYTLLF